MLAASCILSPSLLTTAAPHRRFEPQWESLRSYRCPDWFRDAKLGFWAHWGPQCVPEEGDWYARNMYMEGSRQYLHHIQKYGHPSKFGYKDILPLWKAEHFDPNALIRKYKAAGGRYFVALGVHHDNFDCWNSKYHKWNSVRVGPRKDIVGLWCRAARDHGVRFGVTEHLARSWSWFNVNKGCDKTGDFAGVPYDGNDPAFQSLYLKPHAETTPRYPAHPPRSWMRNWFLRMKDLVDSYQPDLLYTDGGIPFDKVGRELVAHFYNKNLEWNEDKLEAVYTLKDIKESPLGLCGDYREGVGILDVERGIVNEIRREPWQTDTCIGEWYYRRGVQYKDARVVIHMLADIVSKNGNLLLNLPLRPDGTLDSASNAVLEGITSWMAVNQEAIHGTRPWRRFGEGPKRLAGGQFNEKNLQYGPKDIRFTTRGETLYAIVLGWPEDRKVEICSLTPESGSVRKVEMLGCEGPISWESAAAGLQIRLPEDKPCHSAIVLKIQCGTVL